MIHVGLPGEGRLCGTLLPFILRAKSLLLITVSEITVVRYEKYVFPLDSFTEVEAV